MRNRVAIIAAAVAAVLAVFIVLLATSETGRTGAANFAIVGQVAPPVSGPTVGGGEFNLFDERGDWVVVNFFASWCVECRIEHPELFEFNERHQDDGVQLVSVMFNDTEERAIEFFDELGGDWPTLVQGTGRFAIDYSVTAVPETVLISPSGRVVRKWLGASLVSADSLDAAISSFENPEPQSGT